MIPLSSFSPTHVSRGRGMTSRSLWCSSGCRTWARERNRDRYARVSEERLIFLWYCGGRGSAAHTLCVHSVSHRCAYMCVWDSKSAPWWAAGPAAPYWSCTERCSVQGATCSTPTATTTDAPSPASSDAARRSASLRRRKRRWRGGSSSSTAVWEDWSRRRRQVNRTQTAR